MAASTSPGNQLAEGLKQNQSQITSAISGMIGGEVAKMFGAQMGELAQEFLKNMSKEMQTALAKAKDSGAIDKLQSTAAHTDGKDVGSHQNLSHGVVTGGQAIGAAMRGMS